MVCGLRIIGRRAAWIVELRREHLLDARGAVDVRETVARADVEHQIAAASGRVKPAGPRQFPPAHVEALDVWRDDVALPGIAPAEDQKPHGDPGGSRRVLDDRDLRDGERPDAQIVGRGRMPQKADRQFRFRHADLFSHAVTAAAGVSWSPCLPRTRFFCIRHSVIPSFRPPPAAHISYPLRSMPRSIPARARLLSAKRPAKRARASAPTRPAGSNSPAGPRASRPAPR